MFGYSVLDYARDIRDELIDLMYPYIVIFLGTMQFGLFDSIKNYQQVSELLNVINSINLNSHVLITGLIPRPIDYTYSRKRCENYNSLYRLIVQELVRKCAYNVGFLDVFLEFLQLDGTIEDPQRLFVEQIFLSEAGTRKL